ncbi:hypothetical protein DFJ74DRAFT_676275 [Hyaloraphidium curvatum]|nr:hypothetical protein DFJ74DRAFT_676275 [Hyaloraphidium curvatum]
MGRRLGVPSRLRLLEVWSMANMSSAGSVKKGRLGSGALGLASSWNAPMSGAGGMAGMAASGPGLPIGKPPWRGVT